ncbi:MAG TPA: branched-chain amino acid ABC transporter permease, partial [Dehalococcoidia bacterium]|nr:branched-chain amino acid ABC transporter permease [Dehalococcoidia bacterium]
PLQTALILGLAYFVLVLLAAPRRYQRLFGLLGIAVFFVLVPLFMPKFENDILSDYGVYILAAISLNMLIGMTGEISLGHGALLAIAAYTVGIMVAQHQVSLYLAILVGALLATAVGFLLGLPSVRLSGPYLAIATLGLAIALPTLGKWSKIDKWTLGSQGIAIRPKFLPQVPEPLQHLPHRAISLDEYKFFLTAALVAIAALLVWNFRRGRIGRALVAVRDSEPAAQVIGLNLARHKVIGFMFSAFIAGLSGALIAYQLASVHPDTFGLNLSIAILAMIVIGGLDSILGSIIGAVLIRWLTLNTTRLPAPTDAPLLGSHLPDQFKTFPTYAAGVYYGLALILIMIFLPSGIAGAYYRFVRSPYRERLFGRRGKAAPAAAVDELPAAGDSAGAQLSPPTTVDAPREVTRS